LIVLLTFDPITSDDIVSEMLYEDRLVIVAAAGNPWTRRHRVELADLVNENWTLPEPGHPVTSIVAKAFHALGLEAPRVTATAAPGRIRDNLLGTGRFLTVVQESALHFGSLSSLKVLPVKLSMTGGTTRIMTLKKRALSPAAQLFIEHIREAAKPLAKRE
jgi:DNA-binding transcriptional LysR family regulator